MDKWSIILVALISSIYLLEGGRWTVLLLLFTLYNTLPKTISTTTNAKTTSTNTTETKNKHKHEHNHADGESCSTNPVKKCTCKSGLIPNIPSNPDLEIDFTNANSLDNAPVSLKKSIGSSSTTIPKKEIKLGNGLTFKRLNTNDTPVVDNKNVMSLKKKTKRVPKIFKANKPIKSISTEQQPKTAMTVSEVPLIESNFIIFYSSLTGSSKRAADSIYKYFTNELRVKNTPKVLSLDEDIEDLESYFVKTPENIDNLVYIMVLPSYETDSPIDYFLDTLEETFNDFRIDKYPLKKLTGFAVMGLGDTESYPEKFCYQAMLTDKWLAKLGARRLFPLGMACMKTDGEQKINEWTKLFGQVLLDDEPMVLEDQQHYENHEEYDDLSDADNNSKSDDYDELSDSNGDDDSDRYRRSESPISSDDGMVDVEDMGKKLNSDKTTNSDTTKIVKQMVAKDSPTYKSLTKQGYTVVGSHSGVKICRWTKSALRNRGSCYKFAFYGIRSHLCMETTPSLSCSNKCVFCWRHGTNPVGTNWRWEVDQPDVILNGALEGHYKKIKQMRGVPGVTMDRFNEAFRVRHCALSLVGEPIFYPYINEFLGMLHEKQISSFLVCNAQHPDQLRKLNKVTQLYVSIDAPTKQELKVVDRPLFKDYWERLNECLDILKSVQSNQRTVFRLTLVKGFNMSQSSGYADLVLRGQPTFIEIKGATFCGSSAGNGNPLTMQNIPFYEECKRFVIDLCEEINERFERFGIRYEIATEHAHSCCILIAQTKFKIENKWFTHINYDKFFKLLESGEEFTHMDYISETPEWAYWGSKEAGFNPDDVRVIRKDEKLKKKEMREKGLMSEHGVILSTDEI